MGWVGEHPEHKAAEDVFSRLLCVDLLRQHFQTTILSIIIFYTLLHCAVEVLWLHITMQNMENVARGHKTARKICCNSGAIVFHLALQMLIQMYRVFHQREHSDSFWPLPCLCCPLGFGSPFEGWGPVTVPLCEFFFLCLLQGNGILMARQMGEQGHLERHNKCVLVRQKIGKWPPASSHINFGGDAFSALSQELQIFIKSIKRAGMLNVSFARGNLRCHIKRWASLIQCLLKELHFITLSPTICGQVREKRDLLRKGKTGGNELTKMGTRPPVYSVLPTMWSIHCDLLHFFIIWVAAALLV